MPGTCSAALLYHRGKWSALNTPSLSSAVRKSLRKHTEWNWGEEQRIRFIKYNHSLTSRWMVREMLSGGTHLLESWSTGTNRLVLERPVRVPRKAISTPLSEFLLIDFKAVSACHKNIPALWFYTLSLNICDWFNAACNLNFSLNTVFDKLGIFT